MPFDEEKQIQQLIEMYRQGFEEILRVIVEKEAKGQWTRYWRDLLIEVRTILLQLDANAYEWIEQTLAAVYSQASAEAVAAIMLTMGSLRRANPEFAQVHQRAIDVVAQNMADNLRNATQFIGRRINDIFRQITLEETGGKFASGSTVQDMKKKVVQRLLDEGQTAFMDRLGRKWRLDTYAEMVARTTTREAATVATINTCQEFGQDLVRITRHYPTCAKCAAVQGKVFSISGKDERYPKLTEEYRPPLHPHCRCVLTPYVREMDDDAEATERFSNQPLDEDPRSEAEKQAYAEMRDAVTIATTRQRAREVLLNDAVPFLERLKAARKLQRSYEKTGQKPKGVDASILRQYRDWLKENAKYGLITPENTIIPEEKLVGYALNKQHPKGKDKAIAFKKALGYNINNYKNLMDNIKDNLANFPAVFKGEDKYGKRYEITMKLTGLNSNTAKVKTGWIEDKETGKFRLTTIYVDE